MKITYAIAKVEEKKKLKDGLTELENLSEKFIAIGYAPFGAASIAADGGTVYLLQTFIEKED